MAWIVKLLEGTTSTVDLNDGITYFLNVGGFSAPPPERSMSFSGPNLMRHGADLIERTYQNRAVSVQFQMKGTNGSALGKAVRDVWTMLRKAEEWNRLGAGTQIQLAYQWEAGGPLVYFNVIEGALDLGRSLHSQMLLKGTRIHDASVTLICEPFAVGTAETLSNYLRDPSFEVAGTALADWTTATGTGTVVRSTAVTAKYGTAFAELRRTGGTAAQSIQQGTSTAFASGTSISASAWYQLPVATSGMQVEMRLEQLNSGGTFIASSTAAATATGTAWTQLTITSGTATADAATGTIRVTFLLAGGTGTGTARVDGLGLWKSATAPLAWASGREVGNHWDDEGQLHLNYVDVYDLPGDVPALAQVKAYDNEAHKGVWLGYKPIRSTGTARTGIWIEGESFVASGTTTASVVTSGTFSNGSALRFITTLDFTAPGRYAFTATALPRGLYKVLADVFPNSSASGTGFMGFGYVYGSASQIPSSTSEYVPFQTTLGLTTGGWYDVGYLRMPPIPTPEGATAGTITLTFCAAATSVGGTVIGTLDAVMLLPADEGMVFMTKTSARDVILYDSRSRFKGAILLTTADVVVDVPANQVGNSPELHPEGARLYLLGGTGTGGDHSISNGWAVTVIYVPRWLHVS